MTYDYCDECGRMILHNSHYCTGYTPSLDADVAELRARIAELEALLKRKSAALEEAKRALRFVCHECDVDDVRTRPACWDALARIESLEHGKTNDA